MCPKLYKYHFILSMRLGGRQYSHYFTGDNTEAFSSPLYHFLWPVRVKPSIKCKFAWFQSSYSQQLCWLLPWHSLVLGSLPRPSGGLSVCEDPKGIWSDVRVADILFFSLNSHRNAEVDLLLIFQLHGQSQFPWLNVTILHFEQERGLGDPQVHDANHYWS